MFKVRCFFTAAFALCLTALSSPAAPPLVPRQVFSPADGATVDSKGFGAYGTFTIGFVPNILIVDQNAKVLVDEQVFDLGNGNWIWYGSVPATDPAFVQVYYLNKGASATNKFTAK